MEKHDGGNQQLSEVVEKPEVIVAEKQIKQLISKLYDWCGSRPRGGNVEETDKHVYLIKSGSEKDKLTRIWVDTSGGGHALTMEERNYAVIDDKKPSSYFEQLGSGRALITETPHDFDYYFINLSGKWRSALHREGKWNSLKGSKDVKQGERITDVEQMLELVKRIVLMAVKDESLVAEWATFPSQDGSKKPESRHLESMV